jgi:hypothetical protein
MANPRADRPYLRREALQSLNFRVLKPKCPLEDQGYYIGFPCTRGHTIRDQTRHWCYHCVQSIQSNICGADFNYMDHQFRKRGHDFFIDVLDERGLLKDGKPIPNFHKQCWIREKPLGKGDRMDWYTWQSLNTNRITRHILPHKVMYTLFWGDIGKMSVTRSCGNKECLNPLHLSSTWNVRKPSLKLDYLDIDINPDKVAEFDSRAYFGLTVDDIVKREYKIKIQSACLLVDSVIPKQKNLIEITWSDLQNNES